MEATPTRDFQKPSENPQTSAASVYGGRQSSLEPAAATESRLSLAEHCPVEITSLDAPELDVYARLTGAQLRSKQSPEKGLFIAESLKVIACALKAGCEPVSFLMERRQLAAAQELLSRCPDAPVYTAGRETLRQLTGYELTRGVLCAMRRPEARTVEAVCRGARRLAVLEGIADPTNVGAIFRCAAALGVDGVLLTPTCCDPLVRRAVRVSMGTVFQVPWARIGDQASYWPG